MGLGSTVVFTGRVPHDRVRDHYALLDAFVVPRVPDRAAWFTTPLKPYEAMALEIPLVVSDLPALTEIVGPDERGLAFPPATPPRSPIGSGSSWTTRDRRADRAGRSRVGRRGADVGVERARYAALYERILERYPEPAPSRR